MGNICCRRRGGTVEPYGDPPLKRKLDKLKEQRIELLGKSDLSEDDRMLIIVLSTLEVNRITHTDNINEEPDPKLVTLFKEAREQLNCRSDQNLSATQAAGEQESPEERRKSKWRKIMEACGIDPDKADIGCYEGMLRDSEKEVTILKKRKNAENRANQMADDFEKILENYKTKVEPRFEKVRKITNATAYNKHVGKS